MMYKKNVPCKNKQTNKTWEEHNCNLKSKLLVHVGPFKIKYFDITIEHLTGSFDHAYFINTWIVKYFMRRKLTENKK